MNDPMNNHDLDLVDQAVAELIDAPVEEGPSKLLVAQTLDAIQSRLKPAPQSALKIRRVSWMYKVAAMLLLGLCGVAVVLMFNGVGGGGSVAASEVAKRLREARTLSCNWSMELPLNGKPVSMKMLFKQPGKMRIEVPGAVVTILDTSKSKLLVLNPLIKTAFALDIGEEHAGPENQATEIFDWIEKIKSTTGQAAQSIGSRQINGVEAKGFMLVEQGMAMTVWADAKSGMPLRIEIPIELDNYKTTIVMSDLSFDQDMDDSLFEVQAPDGYMLMNFDVPVFHSAPGEEDIVALLRWYAGKSGGKFPEALDRSMDFVKRAAQAEMMEIVMRAGRASVFLTEVGAKNYGYEGKAARLGEKEKIVFWYRVDKSEQYRAIFGDLHIEDVSSQQIPASN